MSTRQAGSRLLAPLLITLLAITTSSCEERYEPPGIQMPTSYELPPELVWEEQPVDPDDPDCFSYVVGDDFSYSPKAWESIDGRVFVMGSRPCYRGRDCSGFILRNDGESWLLPAYEYPGVRFNGIWGSSADDVYVVGQYGIIMHFDGASWTQEYTGYDEDLNAVWGSGPDDVYAVGEAGIILHYDGTSWGLSTYAGFDLIDIWGVSEGAVFTISRHMMFMSDGHVWSEVLFEDDYYFRCVWGSSKEDIYLGARSFILHYDGERLDEYYFGCDATNIRGTSGSDVYAFCQNRNPDMWPSSSRIAHFDGTEWELITATCCSGFYPAYLWGDATTGIRYLDYPDIMDLDFPDIHRNEFEEEPASEYRCVYDLQSIWGSSDDDVFATDWRGNIIHYDGEFWSLMDYAAGEILRDVWGTRPDDVFAVGSGGTVIRYDGFEWRRMDSGSTADLQAVWGSEGDDVYVAGADGSILHFDGHEWQHTGFNAGFPLRTIWGSGPADIYVGGDDPTFFRYDGSSWDWVEYNDLESISSIWGSSSDDVYFVGRPGTIIHFDGEEFRYTDTDHACGGFRAISGSHDGRVYALTDCRYMEGCLLYLEDGKWMQERSAAIGSFKDIWVSPSGAVSGVGTYRSYLSGARVLVGRWE